MIAGQPTTLTFSLVAPSGVTYQSPVVTVESNPWSTSSVLTNNGDGTYSITVTPDRETRNYIKLKVVDGGKTYYHTVETAVQDIPGNVFVVSRVVGPTSNIVYLYSNFTDAQGRLKLWNLAKGAGVIDDTSITVTSDKPTVTFSSIISGVDNGSLPYSYIGATIGWGTVEDQIKATYAYDIIHPVSKIRRRVSHTVDVVKPISPAWVTTASQYAGIPAVLQFTLKFASGKPVVGAILAPTTATAGAVVDPNIVVVDAANGVYGVKVTPGSANFTVNPQFCVGNNPTIYGVGSRTFTVIQTATAGLTAVHGISRQIPIILKDANGPITDATITGVTAGTYLDAVSGSFTVYDATKGAYLVPMIGSSRNTSATSTVENVNITFTRGGNTFTVPVAVNYAYRPYKVTVDEMGSDLSVINLTPVFQANPITTWSAPNVLNMDGTTATAANGTLVNNISTTGKLVWTPTVITPPGKDRALDKYMPSGLSYSTYFYSDLFEVIHKYTLSWTPVKNQQNVNTGSFSSIPAFDFTDIEVTITDDLGGLVQDAVVLETPVPQSKPGVPAAQSITARSGMTLWAQTMVPKTDGSDGKYLLKLHWNAYNDVTNTTSYWIVSVYSPSRNATSRLRIDFGINRAPA